MVFCNAPDDNPFMAGAFHGVTEADAVINVGVSGPGVVKTALEKVRGERFEVLCETIKKTAFKSYTCWTAGGTERRPEGWVFHLVLSIFPLRRLRQLETALQIFSARIGLEHAGAPGTTAALAMLE